MTTSGRRQPRTVLVLLCIALPVAVLVAVATGAVSISLADVTATLVGLWRGEEADQASMILMQIRLPRALLAGLVGAVLAISGAAMQGLFRNPLADPSLIGVTAGASLGGGLAIYVVGTGVVGYAGLTVVSAGAFLGGLIAVILVYRLATTGNSTSVATMLLAGIAITALAGAASNILDFYVPNEALRRISLWRMGGLEGATYTRVLVAAGVAVVVVGCLPRLATALNALLLGESEARHLGIDIDRVKVKLIILVTVGVGTSVALAGTIAFVGLVVPHMMRMLIGADHRFLLPASALAGALLLVIADTLARLVLAPTELPVGIVTAIIGVPFFMSLLRQRAQYGLSQ